MCVVQVFTVSPALVERVLQRLVCLVAEEIHRIFKAVEQFSYSGALYVSVHKKHVDDGCLFCLNSCRHLLR